MAGKPLLDSLDRHRCERHGGAEHDAASQRGSLGDHPAGEPGNTGRIDPIRHAISFKEKKICAKSFKIENINSR
jgi:hypothetical protein